MPASKRFKTKYPGVYYVEGKAVGSSKAERVYYIMYRKEGKLIEEKAGRQFKDDMTPARAAGLRSRRIEGKELSNKEQREKDQARRLAKENNWTIERIWDEYITNNPNIKGMRTYKSLYRLYVGPNFGHKEPNTILALDVDRIRINLLKKRSAQTVQHALELLRRIVNFGVNKQLCEGLKFKIQMPKVDNKKTEDLTPEQIKNLLKTIDEDPHPQAGVMMKMVLYTGMRRGELFRLKWSHINFERGFIDIVDPKGGKDQEIPLNEAARELLMAYRETSNDSEFVFPGRGGKQRTTITNQVKRIKEKAGLPEDFRPLHGLRHVYASMLASSGQVDMYTLQKLLTHKDPQMTQRYAHLRDDTLKKAANIAGSIVKSFDMKIDSEKSKHIKM